jgi:hypothetical protein
VWFAGPQLRRRRYIARTAVFGAATVGTAAFFGAFVGALGEAVGPFDRPWMILGLAAVAALVMVRELVARDLPVPQLSWQVPRIWMQSFWGGAAAFGVVMGMGVFTLQPSALFHLYVLGCFASASPAVGAIFGSVYGIVYVGGFLYATLAWRACESGEQSESMGALSARVRMVGALAAPLVAAVPGAA